MDTNSQKRTVIASIIIPVFNNAILTQHCLLSIVRNTDPTYFNINRYDYEIIIVDNASTDETSDMLKSVKGNIKVISNTTNQGFSIACNQGANIAQGKYLILLNNDTQVCQGWLENLIRFAEENKDAGAVGSKLLYPNGTLQEAGSVMYSDAEGYRFGIGDDPNKDIYNHSCEVDYCSGASFLVPKKIWDELGGLDAETYSPAYYEETDFCFSLRKAGYKVYYNPNSVLFHYDSATSGVNPNAGYKRYLEINRQKFINRWRDVLSRHPLNPKSGGSIPQIQDRVKRGMI